MTTTTAQGAATEPEPSGRGAPDGRAPLFRNGYALMLNTVVSGALGLGYWWLAALHYSKADMGEGSAAIAAMKLLASLTALGFTGALARFVPVAGRTTGRLLARAYALNALASTVITVLFLVALPLWGTHYDFLRGWLRAGGFLVAVLAWSWLTLQDGVLIGLRAAVWVPVGNLSFSVGKAVLLVVLAGAIPATGVFVSWVAAIALSVVPLGLLIVRRLVPRQIAAAETGTQPPSTRQIGRFIAGDYTGSLFNLLVTFFVPVLVAARVTPDQNAVYYIINTIGGTLDLLAVNMAASLTVESARQPALLGANTRGALARMAWVTLPCFALLGAGADPILDVFGPGYASAGAPLLRWLAAAGFTRVIVEVYFGTLRARSRTRQVALLQALMCALVLSLSLMLMPRMGIAGVGLAVLLSQSTVALCALPGLVRVLRGRADPPAGATPAQSRATTEGAS
ncbi:lipopolysaccharide biosynthesis protein [Streptacidiphilus melanogenes]|uniref:lipopolysaccharide biosynthesis protein n=1 Tax=Streptacidiphilus melanogenes TaxID=411235 RepID=UPI000AD8E980|nr:lipopolysaccharide biosynthesis protein [Streptacidiphilus melanogenes]